MIVLDTHVWLWLLHDYEQLSQQAQRIITQERQRNGLRVSAISVWEVALKASQGKLVLPLAINQWYAMARTYTGLVIEPVTPLDAIASTQLPGNFHKDPADRIIVAFARRLQVPLVTCETKILAYPYLETVW